VYCDIVIIFDSHCWHFSYYLYADYGTLKLASEAESAESIVNLNECRMKSQKN